MTNCQTQYAAAAAPYRIAAATAAAAHLLRRAARTLEAWRVRRRRERAALDELAAMGERDLRDIGLNRADVGGVAWGAFERTRDWY